MTIVTVMNSYLQDVVENRVELRLNLLDDSGNVIGKMLPLTRENGKDLSIVQALTAWRNENMNSFFGQFVATEERTRKWMNEVVFKKPGQMLFLIYYGDQLVGHYGFKDLNETNVLLDNAMLGVRCGYPKLMQIAGKTLIEWLFSVAKVRQIYGYVLTQNVTSIMLNRQLGFNIEGKFPMLKKTNSDETEWVMGEPGESSKDGVYCYKIAIESPL